MSDLKPCPFCGVASTWEPDSDFPEHRRVVCQGCGAMTFGTECRERWNRRTPGPATKAKEQLVSLVAEYRVSSRLETARLLDRIEAILAEWPEEG